MKEINPAPFETLGTHLKYLREHSSESLAEVSGAVEINEDNLARIEQGIERPSEEILMLLINHFNMPENEAVQLWELAGYNRHTHSDNFSGSLSDDAPANKGMIMLLAIDVRTQYTDGIEVSINKAGVVMTFTQAGGFGKAQAVSRVGMSLQQAEAVSHTLQQAILQARYGYPKALPMPAPRRIQRRTKIDKNGEDTSRAK